MKRILVSQSRSACALLTPAVLSLLAVLAFGATASAQPKDVAQLYSELKAIENRTAFPLPTPTATLNVGTFDAAKNSFSGLTTSSEDITPGKPPVKMVPVERVNAVNVGLVFQAVNHKTTVQVTVNGKVHLIPVGKSSVTVDIGQATQAKWSILSGGKVRFRDELKLQRPSVLGAGAFTVPALPIALVYEPPQGLLKKNSARYVKTRSEGTTVRLSFSTENSTTVPTDSEFSDVETAKSALGLAAKGFEQLKDPGSKLIAQGFKLFASGLGSASATLTKGTTVTKDHTLAMRNSVTTGFTTAAREGPGAGDVVIYLKNARLVWVAQNGKVRLTFLGAEGQVSTTVKEFRGELAGLPLPTSRSKRFGLDRATIEALLAVDPFVAGGPRAALNSTRFRQIETFEMHGSQTFDYDFVVAVDVTDVKSQTSFTTRSEDMKKGFLSYVGIGVPETKGVKTTTKYGSSSESKVGEEVRVSGHFESQNGEDFAVTAYYDRAFGTLAFVPVALGTEQVAGILTDAKGKPQPRSSVTLVSGGRKLTTVTDAQGRYSFRSTGIVRGPATLIAGALRRTVSVGATPLRGVELRQAK